MHAHAAENLLPFLRPGARVLDVGSGSGYTVSIFHHLVSPPAHDGAPVQGGHVVGIDHIQELVDWSKGNLVKDGLERELEGGKVKLVCGDGRKGYAQDGPYDAIHVGAAAPRLPQELVDQLARPGRMFIPVGQGSQAVYQIDKDSDGRVTEKKLFGVIYIPLTDRENQY